MPTKLDEYPILALVPSAQKIFADWAPFSRMKDVAVAVVRVDVDWKIH